MQSPYSRYSGGRRRQLLTMGAHAASWLINDEVSPLNVTPVTRSPAIRTVAWQYPLNDRLTNPADIPNVRVAFAK